MTPSVPSIAAIQGAPSSVIQALLRDFVETVRPLVRVAGAVEDEPDSADPASADAALRSLSEGRRYPIFQDLGPSSTACSLDAAGVVTACEAVCRDIATGCDLLVLSKFGKLEAERSGLMAAFASGVAAQTPILTSVAPKFQAQWTAFAAPLFVMLPPERSAIERWWRSVYPRRPAGAGAARVLAVS
jgi:hypothetical protein